MAKGERDIDFDGKQEILIGTYGEQMLVYKNVREDQWVLHWNKSFNNPIHNIYHLDMTGDGVKDLFIVTLKTVIILQPTDLNEESNVALTKLSVNFSYSQIRLRFSH